LKPSIPKGTRDFSPVEMNRRNYIFDTIKKVFQKYGYQQIETPSLENLETLTGKYGEEGDKLLFKILNSGPVVDQINKSETDIKLNEISEKGLRYDLTVPFARYVVMHQNEITFPFKRYQIQPVWRADRPQKGRYREFYQCDVDVIGSDSLLNEVELIQIIDEVFTKLGIAVTIKINNRKLLAGLCEVIGELDKFTDIVTAIDKFDKVGIEGVSKELLDKGINQQSVSKVLDFVKISKFDLIVIKGLNELMQGSEVGLKGVEELETLFLDYLKPLNLLTNTILDGTLARGLNYYTGAIIEVKANNVSMGSICGGGRYDNLTGIFGLPNVSGVGISFGADRIYDVMDELKLFPDFKNNSTQLLFVNFGPMEEKHCLSKVAQIRAAGINTELYPDHAKLKKQFAYADNKKIPFVVIVGEEEMKNNTITLKDMSSGEQFENLTLDKVIDRLK